MAIEPSRLFVYGTLQPGHLRWQFLEPYAVGQRTADVPGRLYDSGCGWPVAAFGEAATLVPGTLVDLDPARLDDALTLLDEVEAIATELLARIVVTTVEGESAWAYHATNPVSGMVLIDRWVARDER